MATTSWVYNLIFISSSLFAGEIYNPTNSFSYEHLQDASFAEKKSAILEYWAKQPIPKFNIEHKNDYASPVYARLATRTNVTEANAALLADSTKPWGHTGTDIKVIPKICERKGDYDFTITSLLPIYFHFKDSPDILWPETKRKMEQVLFTAKGNSPTTEFSLGLCGKHKDTENHILMTESSRFLINEALGTLQETYTQWLLAHLQSLIISGFDEFNSIPYQVMSINAISNLYSFSKDHRVKNAAQILLTYLTAIYTVQSIDLKRNVTFRRQPPYRNRDNLLESDHLVAKYAMESALTSTLKDAPNPYTPGGAHHALFSAINHYRVPLLFEKLMTHKEYEFTYFQKLRQHKGIEVHYRSPHFLISAGGYFINYKDFGTGLNNAWAAPTALIPENGPAKRSELILFKGHEKEKKRSNLCVAPNFACGLNVSLPENIPSGCKEIFGSWTFYNFNSEACSLNYGFYAAVLVKPCSSFRCKRTGENYGLLETLEADTKTFADFKASTLRLNGSLNLSYDGVHTYNTQSGSTIEFQIHSGDLYKSSIRKINDAPQQIDTRSWPLASGTFLNEVSSGVFQVYDPFNRKYLVLDYSTKNNPRIYFKNL